MNDCVGFCLEAPPAPSSQCTYVKRSCRFMMKEVIVYHIFVHFIWNVFRIYWRSLGWQVRCHKNWLTTVEGPSFSLRLSSTICWWASSQTFRAAILTAQIVRFKCILWPFARTKWYLASTEHFQLSHTACLNANWHLSSNFRLPCPFLLNILITPLIIRLNAMFLL
jgi:hypothetical protein